MLGHLQSVNKCTPHWPMFVSSLKLCKTGVLVVEIQKVQQNPSADDKRHPFGLNKFRSILSSPSSVLVFICFSISRHPEPHHLRFEIKSLFRMLFVENWKLYVKTSCACVCVFFLSFAIFRCAEAKYSMVVLPMKKINWRDLSGLWRGVVADSSEKCTCFSFLVCWNIEQ